MRGYKGMNADMTCRGMKFAVGNEYHVDGEISVCHNGLHFCEQLIDVFDYYRRESNRFFIVEASGVIKTKEGKSAASDLRIIKEINDIEINRIIYGYGDGYGNGHGYGDDYGNGYGYGYGNCNGDGYGDGYRHGYGDGYGDCYGNGYGNGYGYGDCYGNGYGNGYGSIQRILLIFA